MAQSNELRVFISSTFRDLQEEREHLIKKIFPEIRTLCRERGIRFTEVDLRWGLTDEDVGLGRVIRTCLDEVDQCRPYFIGITGDRYGFIPTYLDIQKDATLLRDYPWIEDASLSEMSITEMEAQYGVLDTRWRGDGLERARFYFRRHRQSFEVEEGASEERQRLEAYQERIRASGASIEQFRDPISLGEIIYDDLATIIKRDFADAKPPTPLEEERSRHEAFSLSRRRAYIANPVYLKKLNEFVEGLGVRDEGLGKEREQSPSLTPNPQPLNPALIVYAESGSGKSSLFAYWAEQYRRKHPEAHVIEHYVGIGATATDHYAVIRHVCMEINERFGRTEEIPSEPAKLDLALGQWLGYGDHELSKRGERMVLILDGLNQLQGTALGLKWIPDVISPSIRLIVSSTVEGTLMELQKRGWERFGMQALSEAERETIVVRYLGEYHKSLNPDQIKRIASDYKCGHPLFLKTLLEELRLIGRHEDLEIRIEEYLSSTGTEDLFQRMLERMEEDHGPRVVRETLSLVWAARSGVDEAELADLTGSSRLKLATLIAGLDYHLVRKEGRLTFFHDYLRRAVEKRYLGDEPLRRRTHLRLAEFFDRSELNLRTALERIWQYDQAGDDAKLVATLANPDLLQLLYQDTGEYEVLTQWSRLRDAGFDPKPIYRESLERFAETADVSARLKAMAMVADILERQNDWLAATEMWKEVLVLASTEEFAVEEAHATRSLGGVLYVRGDLDGAMEQFEAALRHFEALGDRHGVARAVGNMGLVFEDRREYGRAQECFNESLSISEALGDRVGVARSIGNLGLMYRVRGDYDRAIESITVQLLIAEELGDRASTARGNKNLGDVYLSQGEYDRALECFKLKLSISRELGDRQGVASAIGSMALVHVNQEDYDRAIECFNQSLSISEELGDFGLVAKHSANMGRIYYECGEYDRAIECTKKYIRISQELGDSYAVAYGNSNVGVAYSILGEFDRALECFKLLLRLAEEVGVRPDIANALDNIGIAYARKGEPNLALEYLDRGLHERRAIGEYSGIAECLQARCGVLLDLLQQGSMPAYLPAHLPGATSGTWRAMSLRSARENAEESIATATDNSQQRFVFNGRMLLARVDVAEGNPEVARSAISELRKAATTDEQRAALHYWCWKLKLEPEVDHRTEAELIYRSLVGKTPKYEYKKRMNELGKASLPTTPEEPDGSE